MVKATVIVKTRRTYCEFEYYEIKEYIYTEKNMEWLMSKIYSNHYGAGKIVEIKFKEI